MPTGTPKSGINKGWFKKGHIPWDKGIKRLEMVGENNPSKRSEVIEKIKDGLKGRVWEKEWSEKMKKNHADFKREKHPNWKGGQKEAAKRYWKSHKEKVYFYNKERRRKKTFVGSHILKEWKDLKKKYNYCCAICGMQEPFTNLWHRDLTEDHIIPLSKGGSNYIENIQPLCIMCNCKKSNKITISPDLEEVKFH